MVSLEENVDKFGNTCAYKENDKLKKGRSRDSFMQYHKLLQN